MRDLNPRPGPHILPLSPPLLALRALQALLALTTLALSAAALSYLGSYSGFGLNIFTSLATLLYLLYTLLTPFFSPAAYSMWAVLDLEIFLAVFWLSTFATLAALASAFGGGFTGGYFAYAYRNEPEILAAVACTKAAAALTAFEWVAFVASLALTARAIHRARADGGSAPAEGPITNTQEVKMEDVQGPRQEYAQQHPQQQYPQQFPQQQYPQQQTV